MDLTDAVIYVKKLNVPAGMVGACRLDVAYEHFREKPHLFQFVPNEKQVKAANKLLKSINQSQKSRRKKVNGVAVFAAQNLNIAMATNDGIRCQMDYSSSEGDSSLKTSPILTKKKKNKNTTTLQFPTPQPLPFKTAYQTPKQYIKSPI